MGPRRRRPGEPQLHVEFRRHFDPGRRRHQYRDTNCNNQQTQTFAGAQVGTDIAHLNYNGWNLHLGTTAGYLGSRTTDNAGFGNEFKSPSAAPILSPPMDASSPT